MDSSSSESENIWTASSDGDIARVVELIDGGVNVNAQDEFGYAPMYVTYIS